MAWRSQEQVFLGEDMGRRRDYSDDMANLIDEEIESILEKLNNAVMTYSMRIVRDWIILPNHYSLRRL